MLLFIQSYQKWGHPIVDIGRDLYVPGEILKGRLLYRELLYNYGPVVPYLLAGVTAVFGDGLLVFEMFGITTGIISMVALYAIGTRLSGVAVGFSAALLFLIFSFFSTWNTNFVIPFSYSATLATTFALWSFYLLLKYIYGGRSRPSLACSLALMLAALFTKQEVGAAIAVVHVFSWGFHRIPWKAILAAAGITAVICALLAAAFAARGAGEHSLFGENLFKFSDYFGVSFYRLMAGLDYPGRRVTGTLISFAQAAAVTLLASVVGSVTLLFPKKRRTATALAAISGTVCLWLIWRWADLSLFRAALVLALMMVPYFLIRNRRDPLLLLSLFVLFSAPRIPLMFAPIYYGFYLFVPAYIFIAYALGARIITRLPGRRWVACALIGLGAVAMLRFEFGLFESYAARTSVLTTSKGMLRDSPVGRAEAIEEFLGYLKGLSTNERPTVVVFPEGVTINYFADLVNPTSYYLFTPPEIASPVVERRMLGELEAARPDFVIINGNAAEYGRKGFGVEYALEIGDWIRRNYRLERVFKYSPSSQWHLVLLRPKDSSDE